MFLKACASLPQINLFQIRNLKEIHRIKHKKQNRNGYYYTDEGFTQKDIELSDFDIVDINYTFGDVPKLENYKISVVVDCHAEYEKFILFTQKFPIKNVYRLNVYYDEYKSVFMKVDEEYFERLKYNFITLHKFMIYTEYSFKKPYFSDFLKSCENLHILYLYAYIKDIYNNIPQQIKHLSIHVYYKGEFINKFKSLDIQPCTVFDYLNIQNAKNVTCWNILRRDIFHIGNMHRYIIKN